MSKPMPKINGSYRQHCLYVTMSELSIVMSVGDNKGTSLSVARVLGTLSV